MDPALASPGQTGNRAPTVADDEFFPAWPDGRSGTAEMVGKLFFSVRKFWVGVGRIRSENAPRFRSENQGRILGRKGRTF